MRLANTAYLANGFAAVKGEDMGLLNQSNDFYVGQEVKSIFWHQDGQITVGRNGVEKITVVMENGQCAPVPWFAVWKNGLIDGKYNAAMLEGVLL